MKDLKDAIKKLFSFNGEKKLFFAYAAGARKDGSGDGELIVGKSRPTKAAVEEKLKAGTGFFEGVCWTGKKAEDQDVVYFQGRGKPISEGIIKLMKATALTVTKLKYRFKLPPKEEEARAARLAEGDAGAAPGQAPATPAAVPADERARFEQELAALQPRLDACLKQQLGDVNKMRAVLSFAQGKTEAGQLPAAFQSLRMLQTLVQQAQAAAPPAALQAWQAARAAALTQIRDLGKQFAASKHPDAKEALGLLNSTIKNLTENPATARQVQELERYLTEDDVVADVCLAFDLKTPLLTALAGLKA
jgi:hypothetical protein